MILIFLLAWQDWNDFKELVKKSDDEIIQSLEEQPELLQLLGPYQRTPLHYVFIQRRFQTASWLLENGADPNQKDEDGNTPLHIFFKYLPFDDPQLCKGLIELFHKHGADPTVLNNAEQHPAQIRLFANTNPATINGPLWDTCKALAETLMDLNYPIMSQESHEASIIDLAVFNEDLSLLQNLLKTKHPISPQHLSKALCFVKTIEDAKSLVKMGAKIDQATFKGMGILHAQVSHPNLLKFFLDQGADIEYLDKNGHNPFVAGMRLKAPDESLTMLFDAGSDFKRLDRIGETPIMYAALHRRRYWVKKLIESGVDVNLSSENTVSPIFAAFMSGDREILAMFMRAGARLDRRESGHHGDMIAFLPWNGSARILYAAYAKQTGDSKVVDELLKTFGSLSKKNRHLIPLFCELHPKAFLPVYLSQLDSLEDTSLKRVLLGQFVRTAKHFITDPFPVSGNTDELLKWWKDNESHIPETWGYQTEWRGIGIEYSRVDTGLKLKKVYPGFGAEQAGLIPEDIIVEIESLPLAESRIPFPMELQGPKNIPVNLTVKRGDQSFSLDVTRNYLIPLI